MERFISAVGVFVLLGIAWLLSNNKRHINYRVVLWGILLQVVLAVIVIKTGPGQKIFAYAQNVVTALLGFSDAGVSFLFGSLLHGDADLMQSVGSSADQTIFGQVLHTGFAFAVHVLPAIIFLSSLMAVLYYLGWMQRVVQGVARVIARFIGTSGAETLAVASNIFLGQTESPLLIRPYISSLTLSELMTVMAGGFATIAGSMLAAYAHLGFDVGDLMAASVLSAPAALVMAKIIWPETEDPKTKGEIKIKIEKTATNLLDAAAGGALDGMKLAINVGALALAFVAIIAMLDFILFEIGALFGASDFGLMKIFGYAFAPLALVMGVESADVLNFGYLLGSQISINEFVAYSQLLDLKSQLSPRTFTLATYALSGFANFSAIAIQIGLLGGIAPDRKEDLARIALKAMIAGALASWLTAAIAGIMI